MSPLSKILFVLWYENEWYILYRIMSAPCTVLFCILLKQFIYVKDIGAHKLWPPLPCNNFSHVWSYSLYLYFLIRLYVRLMLLGNKVLSLSLSLSCKEFKSRTLRWTDPCKFLTERQTSNISCTLDGNRIVAHSDVVGASSVGAAPTTSSFST